MKALAHWHRAAKQHGNKQLKSTKLKKLFIRVGYPTVFTTSSTLTKYSLPKIAVKITVNHTERA